MTGHASRLIPAFLLVCGCALPLSASPSVTLTWHWSNMRTGDQTPLHPGDAAQIWFDASFTPAVGTIIQHQGQDVEVRGLAGLMIDLGAPADDYGA